MDKDRLNGTIDEVVGRTKRQIGEWTGDKDAQVDGAIQELKGKAKKTWGRFKDASRDLKEETMERPENFDGPDFEHDHAVERHGE